MPEDWQTMNKSRKIYLAAIKELEETVIRCNDDKQLPLITGATIANYIVKANSKKTPFAVQSTLSAIYCLINCLDAEDVVEDCVGSNILYAIYQAGRLDGLRENPAIRSPNAKDHRAGGDKP